MSADVVITMNAWFARHESDKSGQGFSKGEKGYPSKGRVAWAAWGGDAGQSWSRSKSNSIKNARERTMSTENERAEADELKVEIMGRGTAWLDTGTHDDLLAAGQFISTIDKRQGLKVNCPEEVAFRSGWLSPDKLREIAGPLRKSGYGEYLLKLIEERVF